MKKAFFSRVEINMSFASLMAEAKQQMKAGYKPIDYEVITEIYLSQEEFCTLMNKISLPISQYKDHYRSSTTSVNGVWQCIEVKCLTDIRAIAIYTAGRTFPLYAAPILWKND